MITYLIWSSLFFTNSVRKLFFDINHRQHQYQFYRNISVDEFSFRHLTHNELQHLYSFDSMDAVKSITHS